MAAGALDETIDLLQQLIRNGCVNEGPDRGDTGHETRNADLLASHLEGCGADLQRIESDRPGRASLVARIEGSDPEAPSLCLMGHTDVVPANPDTWRRDPFGGELVDGEVWGRGAVDMLNQTAAMAVAFRRLAASGWRPKGTLVYFAVADEEAGGRHGAKIAVERHRDSVVTDYCLTEFGGPVDGRGRVTVNTAEKGGAPLTLVVKGTASHGSVPFGTDNALVTAAEIVRRISRTRGASAITETWREWVLAQGWDEERTATLLDPDRLWEALPTMSSRLAGHAHACTHLTAAPTVVVGAPSQKLNIIPDVVRLGVDIRLLPGQGEAEVRDFVDRVLGPEHGDDLRDRVEVDLRWALSGSSSPTGTPLWALMEQAVQRAYPDASLLPTMGTGGTDARWLRPEGVTTYGFGLLSRAVHPSEWGRRFHGKDERIDVESLDLSVGCWDWIARALLG